MAQHAVAQAPAPLPMALPMALPKALPMAQPVMPQTAAPLPLAQPLHASAPSLAQPIQGHMPQLYPSTHALPSPAHFGQSPAMMPEPPLALPLGFPQPAQQAFFGMHGGISPSYVPAPLPQFPQQMPMAQPMQYHHQDPQFMPMAMPVHDPYFMQFAQPMPQFANQAFMPGVYGYGAPAPYEPPPQSNYFATYVPPVATGSDPLMATAQALPTTQNQFTPALGTSYAPVQDISLYQQQDMYGQHHDVYNQPQTYGQQHGYADPYQQPTTFDMYGQQPAYVDAYGQQQTFQDPYYGGYQQQATHPKKEDTSFAQSLYDRFFG